MAYTYTATQLRDELGYKDVQSIYNLEKQGVITSNGDKYRRKYQKKDLEAALRYRADGTIGRPKAKKTSSFDAFDSAFEIELIKAGEFDQDEQYNPHQEVSNTRPSVLPTEYDEEESLGLSCFRAVMLIIPVALLIGVSMYFLITSVV